MKYDVDEKIGNLGLSGKNIVVTGGAGFIGSHLVEKLVSLGSNVTLFDNMMRGTESFRNIKEIFQEI